jgi:hypothetical protein
MFLLEKSLQQVNNASNGSAPAEAHQTAAGDLREAISEFQRALSYESDNAFAHLLVASSYFNLAQFEEGGEDLKLHVKHLRLAYAAKDSPSTGSAVREEIEAEYALLVSKDIPTAVARYEALAAQHGGSQSRSRFGLRAQWMLAGIYLGDWGTRSCAPNVVDEKKARQKIVQIMAQWPDAPETAFYRQCMAGATKGQEMRVPIGGNPLASRH